MSHLFDIGANLAHESFEEDLGEVIDTARDAGVTRIMITGSDIASTKRAAALAAERDGVWSTCGVHPHHAEIVDQSTLDQLSVLAEGRKRSSLGRDGTRLLS